MRLLTAVILFLANATAVLAKMSVQGANLDCIGPSNNTKMPRFSSPPLCYIDLNVVRDQPTRNDKECGGSRLQAVLKECPDGGDTYTSEEASAVDRAYTPGCWKNVCEVGQDVGVRSWQGANEYFRCARYALRGGYGVNQTRYQAAAHQLLAECAARNFDVSRVDIGSVPASAGALTCSVALVVVAAIVGVTV